MRGFILVLAMVLAVAVVSATSHGVCPDVTSTNTKALLNEIPSINTQLQGCPLPIGSLSFFITNPTKLDIKMNDGSTESIMLTIQNKQVTAVSRGAAACKKTITTTERAVDSVLSSSNQGGALLFLFKNKGFSIKGCTVWTKFTSFFANPLGRFVVGRVAPAQAPPPAVIPAGKPDYCDETYLPGHRDYAQNKALWDRYSSDTDKVCQSQYGRGTPSPCIHSVQLSISGNPYYLCWYNE